MAGSTNHKRRYVLREVQDGQRGMDDHKEPLDLAPRERDFLQSKITNKTEDTDKTSGDKSMNDLEDKDQKD
jgi:hypothetical protein